MGVPAPFCRAASALAVEGVGVAVPELGRDPEKEVVDSNSLCSEGLDRRYGSENSDEAGEPRCLGSIIEGSMSAG